MLPKQRIKLTKYEKSIYQSLYYSFLSGRLLYDRASFMIERRSNNCLLIKILIKMVNTNRNSELKNI
ncbi:MAG: hypothetical protein ACFFFB_22640, partial [Candidatus Heimdallarchaeota archaeon]